MEFCCGGHVSKSGKVFLKQKTTERVLCRVPNKESEFSSNMRIPRKLDLIDSEGYPLSGDTKNG